MGWRRGFEIGALVALFAGGCRGSFVDPCGDAGSVGVDLSGAPCQTLNARAEALCTRDASACVPIKDPRGCLADSDCCVGLCCSQDTNRCDLPSDAAPPCPMYGRKTSAGIDYLPPPWGTVDACTTAFGCQTPAHICSQEMNSCLDTIADAGTCQELSNLGCSLACRYPFE